MGIGDEDLGDEILLPGAHAGAPLAAPVLRPIGRERHPLDVARVRHGDDHILALDQVFDVGLEFRFLDDRPPRRAELLLHPQQFVAEDAEQFLLRRQNLQILGDPGADFPEVVGDLVPLQAGQALEAHLQNGLGLFLGEPVRPVSGDLAVGLVDERDQRRDVARGPRRRHQFFAGILPVLGLADQLDDRIQVGDRDRQAGHDMGPLPCLAELIRGPAGNDFLAEIDERLKNLLEIQHFGLAAVQRQHVHAEAGLQRREGIELVEHDFGHGIALDFDHHPHAVPVGFVAEIRDPLDLLVPHRLGDDLDHPGLVHLVGNLGNDDGFAVLGHRLDLRLAPDDHRTSAGREGLPDAVAAQYHAAGREIGTLHMVFDQLANGEVRVVDQRAAGVDDFAEIVRRNVGRHADGNAARAVDQEVRELRRQHRRFPDAVIVVGLEIDRILVDVLQQMVRRTRQPGFGVAHGRRPVAVHGAEIALTVYERQAHGEILGHADQRIVDRRIAVRVVFAHDVADDSGRLAERPVVVVAALLHGVKNPAVDRLQAVANIGQRPADDHAHGVIEVGRAHLVFDGDRFYVVIEGLIGPGALGRLIVGRQAAAIAFRRVRRRSQGR